MCSALVGLTFVFRGLVTLFVIAGWLFQVLASPVPGSGADKVSTTQATKTEDVAKRYEDVRKKARTLTAAWGQGATKNLDKLIQELDQALAALEAEKSARASGAESTSTGTTTSSRTTPPAKETRPSRLDTPPDEDALRKQQKNIDEKTYHSVPKGDQTAKPLTAADMIKRAKEARKALADVRDAWTAGDRSAVERYLREIEDSLQLYRKPGVSTPRSNDRP